MNELFNIMKNYNNDSNLDDNKKSMYMNIMNIYLNINTLIDNFKNMINNFNVEAKKLEEVTSGIYRIETTLKLNKVSLKGYILNSNLCKELEKNDINEYSVEELKKYINNSSSHEKNILNKALYLYENLEHIEFYYNNEITKIVNELSKYLDSKNLSKYNEETSEYVISKTKEEINNSRNALINEINQKRNNNLIDENIKNCLIAIVDFISNYYNNGIVIKK